MNRSIIALAVTGICATGSAIACDCALPANYGNPICAAQITAALNGAGSKSNAKANSTAISQSRTSVQTRVSDASNASVGPVSATGGRGGQGGQGGAANSSATGGVSSAMTGASNSGGNSYSTSYDAARIPVTTAAAGIGQTTAGCRFAEGLGVQTMPAGTSVGFSFKDHDCARFQLAQFFYTRGQDIAGDKIMCQIREVSDALGADCPALVHEIQVTQAVYPVGERERRQARAQWDQVQK